MLVLATHCIIPIIHWDSAWCQCDGLMRPTRAQHELGACSQTGARTSCQLVPLKRPCTLAAVAEAEVAFLLAIAGLQPSMTCSCQATSWMASSRAHQGQQSGSWSPCMSSSRAKSEPPHCCQHLNRRHHAQWLTPCVMLCVCGSVMTTVCDTASLQQGWQRTSPAAASKLFGTLAARGAIGLGCA